MLLHRTVIPGDGVRRAFRHPLESQWGAGLALSLPLVAAAVTTSRLLGGLSGPVQALIALVGAPLAVLYLWFLWDAARGSRRPSNWHVVFTDTGLVLNLRSWRHAHLAPAETLVEITFGELRSAGRVFERVTTADGHSASPLRVGYVELDLATDTAPIRAALAAERALAGDRGSRGRRSGTPHEPVQATGPHTLRVELVPGLLEALGERVRLLPDRETDLDRDLAGKPPEERARVLVWHGHAAEACRIGRLELGLSGEQAETWVRDLVQRAA